MSHDVIVRMPPSPTGWLHLGTARTALFNWCFARANKGQIVFRWEDTDKTRSKKEYETEILAGLNWLGMDFEKKSDKFTRQTDNTERHNQALKDLWKADKIFPCFTTAAELDQLRYKAQKEKKGFVFWSPYRSMDHATLQTKIDSGKPFVWRLRVTKGQNMMFTDLVKGSITVNTDTIGDITVARQDGSVLYMLANVIDDLEDQISHVIRGDDHISNTPKQLCILAALGEKPFTYAHIPLVLDAQNKKLSKRNVTPGVCVLIRDFQEQGFLPEAVVNGLAFLGWNPKTTEEIFSLADLEKIFDLKKVNPAAAQYDFGKMEWFNQQWIKQLEITKLKTYFLEWNKRFKTTNSLREGLSETILGRSDEDYLENEARFTKALNLVRQKASTLPVLADELEYLCFDLPASSVTLHNEKMKISPALADQVIQVIKEMLEKIEASDFIAENIRTRSIEKIAAMGLKNGQFLWPFRVALSGREKSVGPFDMAEVLGKKECLERFNKRLK